MSTAYQDTSFSTAVQNASREPLDRENITPLDEMIMDQLAGDQKLTRIISKQGYTDDVHGDSSMVLRDALVQRLNQLRQQLTKDPDNAQARYTYEFYTDLLNNPRYADLTVLNPVNYASTDVSETTGEVYKSHFKAATFRLPDGTLVVSYAGTGSEVASWVEDGRFATTDEGTDAQRAALEYLEHLMRMDPHAQFILNGYSKGGNLALYAAIMTAAQERIIALRNFDGPGFGDDLMADEEFQRRYAALKERLGEELYCLTPENSLVGQLMNDHDVYIFVDTDGTVFLDHDYTAWHWNAETGGLDTVAERTALSVQVEDLMEDLLDTYSDRELDRFFDMLEKLCDTNGIVRVDQLGLLFQDENGEFSPKAGAAALVEFYTSLSGDDRELFLQVIGDVVSVKTLYQVINGVMQDKGLNGWKGEVSAAALTGAALVMGAIVVAGAAVAVTVSLLADCVKKLGELVVAGAKEIYDTMKKLWNTATDRVAQFYRELKEKVVNSQAWKDLTALYEGAKDWVGDKLDTAQETLDRWLDEGEQAVRGAAKWTREQIIDPVVEDFKAGWSWTKENVFEPVGEDLKAVWNWGVDGLKEFGTGVWERCRSLTAQAVNGLTGCLSKWGNSIRGYAASLGIDLDGLGSSIRLTGRAAKTSSGMGGRLRSIMRRLDRMDVPTSVEGVFTSLSNLYNLCSAEIIVDLYDGIGGMHSDLQSIDRDYRDLRGRLSRALAKI